MPIDRDRMVVSGHSVDVNIQNSFCFYNSESQDVREEYHIPEEVPGGKGIFQQVMGELTKHAKTET